MTKNSINPVAKTAVKLKKNESVINAKSTAA
jgi:hypothetical protein